MAAANLLTLLVGSGVGSISGSFFEGEGAVLFDNLGNRDPDLENYLHLDPLAIAAMCRRDRSLW